MALLFTGGSRRTVATGCAGPTGESASTAAARHAETRVDGVRAGAGFASMDNTTRGPSARPEGDRFEGGGQLVGQRGVGEYPMYSSVAVWCISTYFFRFHVDGLRHLVILL